jgi:hypothetical protein
MDEDKKVSMLNDGTGAEKKVSMLTDGTGAVSSMRVSLLIVVMSSCLVAIGGITGFILSIILNNGTLSVVGVSLGGVAAIIGALLAPVTIGKSVQSFAENQSEVK